MARTGSTDRIAWFLALAGTALLISGIRRQQQRMNFQGASVVITGGSRGLGLEIARVFAREGARLTLLARDKEELERARRELITLGGYVIVHACDIEDQEEVKSAMAAIVRERGRIDVLVNNAGVIQVGPFENMTLEDFDKQLGIHFWGPLYMIRSVLPVMKMQGRGRIVNISSIAGTVAVPHLVPHSSAKFALTGLSDGLRAELARDGIRVTTVIPGLMRTGSHVNVFFKGRHRREFRWFAAIVRTPLLSISSERAARRIVEACRYGEASITLGLPAVMLKTVNVLFPGLAATFARLTARLLPRPDSAEGYQSRTGWEFWTSAQSRLIKAADRAIARNNEQKKYPQHIQQARR